MKETNPDESCKYGLRLVVHLMLLGIAIKPMINIGKGRYDNDDDDDDPVPLFIFRTTCFSQNK